MLRSHLRRRGALSRLPDNHTDPALKPRLPYGLLYLSSSTIFQHLRRGVCSVPSHIKAKWQSAASCQLSRLAKCKLASTVPCLPCLDLVVMSAQIPQHERGIPCLYGLSDCPRPFNPCSESVVPEHTACNTQGQGFVAQPALPCCKSLLVARSGLTCQRWGTNSPHPTAPYNPWLGCLLGCSPVQDQESHASLTIC